MQTLSNKFRDLRAKIIEQSQYLKSYRNSINLSIILGVAVAGLTFSNIYLLNLLAGKEVKYIVTPPVFTQEISMRGDQVSESYMTMWADFTAHLIGNISPSRMDIVFKTLQKMIPAKHWEEVREQMNSQLARLKIRKVEEKFSIKDVSIDPTTKVVWVTGEKETTAIRTGRTVSEMWTFEVRIEANGVGAPIITHLKQYAGAPQKKRRSRELKTELANKDTQPTTAQGKVNND